MTYFNEFGQARLGWNVGVPSGGGGIDSDAQAFITAASITDSTQQSAIITLVTQLKTYGIWTKMKALYPFVGGTAAQHRFNLKDPRPVNEAFYLDFLGGGTHSATGYLPNGNSYADTKLIPNSVLLQNSTHISVYSRTDNNSQTPLISAADGSTHLLNIWPRYGSGNDVYLRVNSSPTSPATTSPTSTGLYLANRISSSETRNFINNGLFTQSASSTGLNSGNVYLSRQGSAYDNRESAFASIGDGLTDTEAANFYTAVQTFQTTLGRQV